jgi:putative glutamine amidotransferase
LKPVVLVSACYAASGTEFSDPSISLSNQYCRRIARAGGLPIVVPLTETETVAAEYLEIADAVMLTGGEDLHSDLYAADLPVDLAQTVRPGSLERDDLEISLVRGAFAARKPFLGICRGHQIANVAFGGRLVVDIEQEMPGAEQHRDVELGCGLTHRIEIAQDSLMRRLFGEGENVVNSSHHQAVLRVADELRATAKTTDGIVEAMELSEADRSPFFLTIQFHPERTQKKNHAYQRVFDEFVEAARRTVGKS